MTSKLVKVMAKSKMGDFFDVIKEYGDVHGPVKTTEKTHSFQKVETIDELDLTYTRTMIPPKKYFIAPKETIFTFDKHTKKYFEPSIPDEKRVLFGVHACDINALKLLAKVFLEEFTDKTYQENRDRTLIVGISCNPDEGCFCKSTGTSYANDGYDLFFHDLGKKYLIQIGSPKGYNIADKAGLFEAAKESDVDLYKEKERERLGKYTNHLEMTGLQDYLDLSYDSEIWQEYGDKCLSCGTCNLVCPRCRCYDVKDNLNLDLTTGERVRTWYSCMLKDHGLIAGGYNFRSNSMERIRNRFNCKGSLREEMPNCVGCGRCSIYCPAEIDFVEVMKKVRGEYQ